MPVVYVGKEFFLKELRAYPSPALAFWRENFSNSLDAGADTVSVRVTGPENGIVQVIFSDNGCGMSKDVMENVFFALGRSTKDENSSGTGGFGRARIITLFAHESYAIRTQNLSVIGNGPEYTITEVSETVRGTQFVVNIDAGLWSKEHLLRMFRYFIDECDTLPAKVFLNGEEIIWKPVRGRWIRDLEYNGQKFATVSYAKTVPQQYANKAIIRVNGTAMFNRSLDIPGWVIINLVPEVSRKVLTSNRDGFAEGYQTIFTKLMNELASEKRTALRPKPERTFNLFEGSGFFSTYARTGSVAYDGARVAEPVRNPADFARIVRDAEERVLESFRTSDQSPATASDTDYRVLKTLQDASGRRAYSAAEFLPDIPVVFESSSQKMLERSKDFVPTNWKFRIVGGKPLWGDHGDIVRLYFAIKLIAEKALQQLADEGKISYVSWTVGFIFSDDLQGLCFDHPKGRIILINPVKENGTLKFRMPQKKDIIALVAEVIHEVTHIVAPYHDEDFANIQTELYAAINPWSLETEIKAL